MEELPQGEWQGRLSWVGGQVFESGCSRRQELLGSWGNGRMRKMLETIKGKKKKKKDRRGFPSFRLHGIKCVITENNALI